MAVLTGLFPPTNPSLLMSPPPSSLPISHYYTINNGITTNPCCSTQTMSKRSPFSTVPAASKQKTQISQSNSSGNLLRLHILFDFFFFSVFLWVCCLIMNYYSRFCEILC